MSNFLIANIKYILVGGILLLFTIVTSRKRGN